MYNRMLIPLDGSELAEEALPYAEEVAGKLGLEVVLFYVCTQHDCEFTPMHQSYVEQVAEAFGRQARKIQQKADSQSPGRGVRVRGELVVGDPAEEILCYSDANDIDLIVIATHGHSGIKRWVVGSVAEKVLHSAKVPIYLVRPQVYERTADHEEWSTKTIIVPLDGSELAESVIPYVKDLASKMQADVVLLQVLPETHEVHTSGGRTAHVQYTKGHMKEAMKTSRAYLQKVSEGLGLPADRLRVEVRTGSTPDEIIKFAGEMPGGLVAMSTHGRSGLGRWAYGSIADKVLHGADTPVLLVRCPGACQI